MARSFGIPSNPPSSAKLKSGSRSEGDSHESRSPAPDSTQRNNILQFARADISLPFRVDSGDSRRPLFITSLKRGKLSQACLDVLALAFGISLVLITGLSITVSLFLLLFYSTY